MSLEFITEGLIKVHHQEYEEICELATIAVAGKLIFSILNDKKNLNIDSKDKDFIFSKKFMNFKSLINKNNKKRLNCILLPIDAVLKALK